MENTEGADNQATPAEGQVATTNAPNASEPANAEVSKAPATVETKTAEPEFDYRKSYDELRKEFTKVTMDRSELRKSYDLTAKELKELREAQKQLTQMLQQATERPINPEEFIRDLQTQGPKALDKYLESKLKGVHQTYEEKIQAIQAKLQEESQARDLAQMNFELYRRRTDKEGYPDFAKLEPEMQKIVDSPNCPIDVNQPIADVYDALYNLAKAQQSDKAIAQAVDFGRKQAEGSLAKEAATAVAGGGKTGAVTNPAEIKDTKQLRKYFVDMLGEAE